MILKNVSRYYPDVMPFGENVQYFQSEDGKDFYDSIPLFTKKYKLCIESGTSIICSISEDVSGLYPAGYTVVETDILPKGCDIYGGWMYENEEVKAVPVDYAAKAESERQRLLKEANEATADWLTDLQLGLISDEDKASLILWRTYIKALNAMDLVNVGDKQIYSELKWPNKPE